MERHVTQLSLSHSHPSHRVTISRRDASAFVVGTSRRRCQTDYRRTKLRTLRRIHAQESSGVHPDDARCVLQGSNERAVQQARLSLLLSTRAASGRFGAKPSG